MIKNLVEKIQEHEGVFLCEAIGSEESTKLVKFTHSIEPPRPGVQIPKVGDLNEFYSSIGSLTLYSCPDSFESAYYIAHPSEWEELESDLSDWTYLLDEDEEEEALPSWFGSHKVIGEIPSSGNYLLVVTSEIDPGAIYSFDHDGFEFKRVGSSLEEFVQNTIDPDPGTFCDLVTYMRFTSEDSDYQWWARELRHASGKIVRNDA